MENLEKGFRIGEFARLAQVTKDTLFHYERMGVLVPDFIDDTNGYRYYSAPQFFHLEMIKALRESGLSLEEIRDFKNHYNPERYLRIMTRQRDVLEKQIRHMEQLRNTLDSSIRMTEDTLNEELDLPKLIEEEKQYLITLLTEDIDEDITPEHDTRDVSNLILYCAKNDIEILQPVGSVIPAGELARENPVPGTLCFPLKAPVTDVNMAVKPAGTYLVLFHKDLYGGREEAWRTLFAYIREHGLRVSGNGYEFEVCGYLNVETPEEFIIRYSVQVEEKE